GPFRRDRWWTVVTVHHRSERTSGGGSPARSAVPQFRTLVTQLTDRGDESPIAVAVDGRRLPGGDPVAVLEGQFHAEVAFQTGTDRVGGQGAQQLAARRLIRWGRDVVGEIAADVTQLVDHAADGRPRVRKGIPHA